MAVASAMSPTPLSAFPQISTRDVDALGDIVTRHYGEIKFSLPNGARGFKGISNHCQLPALGLTYASNGAAIHIELPRFGYFGQLFSFRGKARATVGRSDTAINADRAFVANVDEALRLDYAEGFEQIVIKFDGGALVRKLEALVGAPIVGKLCFEPSSALNRPEAQQLQQTMSFLIERLDAGLSTSAPLAVAEFEQTMMILFMSANQHSHMHLLSRRPSSVAPWQVRRVEEYIEANWDQPITVEALAVITGTSTRSIFHSFKKSRGYSPMEFVKHLRLQRARQMLEDSHAHVSVTTVAFNCGFGNLGHFAQYYFQKFGERPSDTLRRAKGAPGVNGKIN